MIEIFMKIFLTKNFTKHLLESNKMKAVVNEHPLHDVARFLQNNILIVPIKPKNANRIEAHISANIKSKSEKKNN